jgi:hypothetical protein
MIYRADRARYLSRLNLGNRKIQVRDMWAQRSLGTLSGSLRQSLAPHSASLLHLRA